MKRMFLFIFVISFLSFSLSAEKPERDFPYYYYNTSEKTFGCYSDHLIGRQEILSETDNQTISLLNDGTGYYLWVKYISAPSEIDIKYTLKTYKDIVAKLSKKLNEKNNRNVDFCIIFSDEEENLICAATYCEP